MIAKILVFSLLTSSVAAAQTLPQPPQTGGDFAKAAKAQAWLAAKSLEARSNPGTATFQRGWTPEIPRENRNP